MPKKVKKTIQIKVPAKRQGYWVKKENVHKGERTIKTKGEKVLKPIFRKKQKGFMTHLY